MPRPSMRASRIPASPIRKLAPLGDLARARGVRVFHLNIGQPDIETPRPMIEAYRNYDARVLEYGPSTGVPALRSAVAEYYTARGNPVRAEQVHVTTGGSEALAFAFSAVADPGDELLIFEPFYANYAATAAHMGLHLKGVRTSVQDGFHLPADAVIEAAIGPRTRGIVINSPGNPTGVVYTENEMRRLGAIAERHDLYLISDEVYSEFVYAGTRAISALSLPCAGERVVVVDSVSKRFSACGARVGFLITRSEELDDAFLRMGYVRLCPATVDQYAATAGYGLPRDYFAPVIQEYQRRRDLLVSGLNAIRGVRTTTPEGAFYAIAQLPVDDCDAFCDWLLTDYEDRGHTLMLAPGAGFYTHAEDGRCEARFAYILNVEALERSLEILAGALRAYPGSGPGHRAALGR